MSSFIINLSILAFIVIGIAMFMLKKKDFKTKELLIILSLLSFWTVMYMQKNSSLNKHEIINEYGKYVWPIIAGMYQLMQVVMRLPYGKLSGKLNSRKMVVQISFLIVLISLAMMIISKVSVWSMIIAAIAMGQFGSLFGLDAQYVSENYDIKRAFISSGIVFAIPVVSSFFSKTIFAIVTFNNVTLNADVFYWIILGSLIFGFVTFILFSISKEDVSTIHLDTGGELVKKFNKRSKRDIAAISLVSCFMAFGYNFVSGFSGWALGDYAYLFSIAQLASFASSFLMAVYLKKYFSAFKVKVLSLSTLLISLGLIGLLLIIGNMNSIAWMMLISIASIGFGSYLVVLFGTTLHFDHKYPALVLGVFLTVKSFALGTSTIASEEIIANDTSGVIIGILILAISLVSIISAWLCTRFIIKSKSNGIDELVDDAIEYEKQAIAN